MARKLQLSVAALLAVAFLAACAPMPAPVTPEDKLWQTWGEALQIANDSYEETMIAVGVAHARGLIRDDQLESARIAGRGVKAALEAARRALLAHAAGGEPPAIAIAAAQGALLDLLRLVTDLGIPQGGGR